MITLGRCAFCPKPATVSDIVDACDTHARDAYAVDNAVERFALWCQQRAEDDGRVIALDASGKPVSQ